MANVKVKVQAADGDLVVSVAGSEPVTYRVKDGVVTVAQELAQDFANAVGGSVVVGGTAPASKE